MASKTDNQRRLFEFLSVRFRTQEPFTLSDLRTASGYTWDSFENYRSKQFGTLLVSVGQGLYRVSYTFRRFSTWQRFSEEVVSQKRKLRRQYRSLVAQRVMSFEFFMPLRNEEWLREALDSLFFKDQVWQRVRVLLNQDMQEHFVRSEDETEDRYLERVCAWISNTFGGYSISHVSGRFKVGDLKTRSQIAEEAEGGGCRYLVDETTAVVRFLFPCGKVNDSEEDSEKIANAVRWFFDKLFVETILEVVNGEDEIWLVESGFRSQLRVFRACD